MLKKIISAEWDSRRKHWKCLLGHFLLDYWTSLCLVKVLGQLFNQALSQRPFTHTIGNSLPGSPHCTFVFLVAASPSPCISLQLKPPCKLPVTIYLSPLCLRLCLFNKASPYYFIAGSSSFLFWWSTSHSLLSGLPCLCLHPYHLAVWCVLMLTTGPSTLSFYASTNSWHWILDFTHLQTLIGFWR